MGVLSSLKGLLLKRFRKSAELGGLDLPKHFLTPEHFDAIDRVIRFRREAITKQGKSFKDLEGDLEILQTPIFGDVGDAENGREESLASLKRASVDEKRDFLKGVYHVFNHGKFDQKPAFAKWVTTGNAQFGTLMAPVRADQELLSSHSISIMASHVLDDPKSDQSTLIRDVIELIGAVNGVVEATAGARTELNKGFGRIFKIQTDTGRVLSYDGDEFEAEFDRYVDGLIERVDKIQGSKANPADHMKWTERLKEAESLVAAIREAQNSMLSVDPNAVQAPEVT